MGPARSGRHILRGLDTSNGCQDHTTWPYAARPTPRVSTGLVPTRRSLTKSGLASVVGVPSLRSRASKESPPCDDVCAPDAAASTAPRPAFSDDRETPLLGDGMAGVVGVIWVNREANYFCGREFFDLRCRANQCWAHMNFIARSSSAISQLSISTVAPSKAPKLLRTTTRNATLFVKWLLPFPSDECRTRLC
jgi:hypothetical protein